MGHPLSGPSPACGRNPYFKRSPAHESLRSPGLSRMFQLKVCSCHCVGTCLWEAVPPSSAWEPLQARAESCLSDQKCFRGGGRAPPPPTDRALPKDRCWSSPPNWDLSRSRDGSWSKPKRLLKLAMPPHLTVFGVPYETWLSLGSEDTCEETHLVSVLSLRTEKSRVEACPHPGTLLTPSWPRVCPLEGPERLGWGRSQTSQWDHVCCLTPGFSRQTFVLVCHRGTIQAAVSPWAGAGGSPLAAGGYF